VPKFKVGDKVTVDYFLEGEIIYIRSHLDRNTYDIKYDGYIAYSIEERCISLVNNIPKFEIGQKVSYVYKFQAYVGIITARHYEVGLSVSKETTYDITTYGNITHENIKESYVYLYKEETELPKSAFEIAYDLRDYLKSTFDNGVFKVKNTIPGIRPIPNKLPDRVVFNSNKGKTTILFSLHDNGLPPYAPFTSKTVGSDKFDKSMGFLIAYYKYINREMNEDRLREQIELIFDYNKNDRTMYLSGAIEQALLPHYTKERIFEVFEAILKCEGTFDLLQYEETKLKEQRKKETLRKKNINKQIKKREIEIKGLKEKL
jgi:hypothetical protein